MPPVTSGALRFHELGEPLDVLCLERTEVPEPPAGTVRVRVLAAGLNPADWELCRGFMPAELPRGVGYDVAGVVDAVGDAGQGGSFGPEVVQVGDVVVGTADLTGQRSCGAAEAAVLTSWSRVPDGLDPVQASTLPMVVQTAAWSLDLLGVKAGATLLVHGAGGMVGYAAVQLALRRGARVVATAGPTFAADLEGFGAGVTAYGEGMPERVRVLTGGADVDLVLDTPRPSPGVLPALIALAGGDARRVMTISNHEEARRLGARVNVDELHPGLTPLPALLREHAALAASGDLRLPIAATYRLEQWREAVQLSLTGAPHGKVVLVPDRNGIDA